MNKAGLQVNFIGESGLKFREISQVRPQFFNNSKFGFAICQSSLGQPQFTHAPTCQFFYCCPVAKLHEHQGIRPSEELIPGRRNRSSRLHLLRLLSLIIVKISGIILHLCEAPFHLLHELIESLLADDTIEL